MLKDVLDRETLWECQSFIYRVRESKHNKVKNRQKAKFSRLLDRHKAYMQKCSSLGRYMYSRFDGHSNTNNYTESITTTATTSTTTFTMSTTSTRDNNYIRAKWVVNLSSISLTKA